MALQIPETEEAFWRFQDEAIDAYSEWLARSNRDADASDLGTLLDWKWNYGDGRLDRLTRRELEEFLLEWCPRKLSMSLEGAALLPESTAIATRFLAEVGILSSGDSPAKLADHARRLIEPFVAEMDNPENFGMAKSIFNGMGLLDDPSKLTAEDLERAMEEFNQLPYEQRKAITDPSMSRLEEPEPMVIGPVAEPSPEAVRASAARAPMLRGFSVLAEYLGPQGKQLTKTDALKLADARALVELLGTGESMEPAIGSRTFKVQTARELPHLDHWQWWAQQSGAIRTVRGRLVAVKAWQKRVAADPVGEALKSIRLLFHQGVNASYSTWYYSELDNLVDQAIGLLLAPLMIRPGPLDYNEMVEQVEMIADSQEVDRRFESEATRALADTLDLLERAGVIEQHEITTAEDRYQHSYRAGGKITITPLGAVALIELLRTQGVEVTTLGDPSSMELAELADLIGSDEVGPDQWWSLADRWLDGRADRTLTGSEMLELFAEEPAILLLFAGSAPDHRQSDVLELLRTITGQGPPQDELVAIAMVALIGHDPEFEATLTPGQRDQISLTMIAVTGADAPETTMESLVDLGADKVLDLIKIAAQHPCASSEKGLELLGNWYPDKKIAKLARKELFRLRSKLAAARS